MTLIDDQVKLADQFRIFSKLDDLRDLMALAKKIIQSASIHIVPEVQAAFDKAIKNDPKLNEFFTRGGDNPWADYIQNYANNINGIVDSFAQIEVLRLLANHGLFDMNNIDTTLIGNTDRLYHHIAELELAKIKLLEDDEYFGTYPNEMLERYKSLLVTPDNFYLLVITRYAYRKARRGTGEITEKIKHELTEMIYRYEYPKLVIARMIGITNYTWAYDKFLLKIFFDQIVSRWSKDEQIAYVKQFADYDGANFIEINQWAADKLAELN